MQVRTRNFRPLSSCWTPNTQSRGQQGGTRRAPLPKCKVSSQRAGSSGCLWPPASPSSLAFLAFLAFPLLALALRNNKAVPPDQVARFNQLRASRLTTALNQLQPSLSIFASASNSPFFIIPSLGLSSWLPAYRLSNCFEPRGFRPDRVRCAPKPEPVRWPKKQERTHHTSRQSEDGH